MLVNKELVNKEPVNKEPVSKNLHQIEIMWACEQTDAWMSDDASIVAWANAALNIASEQGSEISLKIVSSEEMSQLNTDYRGKSGTTNVLSFPMAAMSEDGRKLLGDIAICMDVVREEAIAQDKLLKHHFAHMLVHGVLHLLGFDHIENQAASEMEDKETLVLQGLGFPKPYEKTNESHNIRYGDD